MKNRDQQETELLELIETYLKKVTPNPGACDDEGIAAAAYFLLGEVWFSDNLLDYLLAAASALAAFAKGEVLVHLKRYMRAHEVENLCDMLKRMIEFCNSVEQNDKIRAQFDQLMWEISETSNVSIETLVREKNKYEGLLKSLSVNNQ